MSHPKKRPPRLPERDGLYERMIKTYDIWLPYVLKTSDAIGMISVLEKPYSKRPPNCIDAELLSKLEPCLIDYQVGIGDWNDIIGERWMRAVRYRYKCQRLVRQVLLSSPNLLIIGNGPDDMHFYRNGKIWMYTITHEQLVFFESSTDEDRKMFFETIYE